ncbi:LamG-like jellyroll fold domain-containing protein [Streptomyces longwoodensis]|uniref:LamG-like jellyroll fold domain-containing protein n=1 Tax=Streptomyces longwoodensis TaxID=68231 RepID=UPI0033DDF002
MPLLVEMGWGGLIQYPATITWTDISAYVDQARSGVSITRGASDELSDTQPGTASLLLDNSDGRFTPGNAASPYYPFVRRNAPIRISVAVTPTRTGAGPWPLAMFGDDFDDDRVDPDLWPASSGGVTEVGGRARVPLVPGGSATFQSARVWTLTGSQIAVKVAKLPTANGSSAAAARFMVNSTTSGTRVGFTYNAVTGSLRCVSEVGFSDGAGVTLTYSGIDHLWLRLRESAGTLYWETSPDGFTWTVQRSLATPAWVTSQLVVVDLPASRTGGTADYAEWDLLGATVRPRFYGMVNEFPVDWEGLASHTRITCTDLFKRLNRLPALRSMLAEEILHPSVPGVSVSLAAYYPLTEESGATAAGDIGGQGCGALAVTQVGSGGAADFGSDGLAETGDGSVAFTPASASAGRYLVGDLGAPFQSAMNSAALNVEFWFKTTATSRAILGLYEPSLDHQVAYTLSATGELCVEYTDSGGTLSVHNSLVVVNDGQWHHVVHQQYGTPRLYVDGTARTLQALMPAMVSLRQLHIGGYRSARLFTGQIAHVALSLSNADAGPTLSATHYQAGTSGFSGEDADVRVQRLARYADLSAVTVQGSTFDPIASQGPAGSTVVTRMREVEATESARLFAQRDGYGLTFQSRDLRYNPDPASEVFTIDYADLETGDVQLADDDQKLCNSLTASRPGGATQRVTAPSSILAFGLYDPGALSILKTNDLSVLDAAYWRVSRYADPAPELREVPIEAYTMANYLAILSADISSYFSVTGMPSQAPSSSVRATVEGYTETIKAGSHRIQFHTSAGFTDTVWVLDDPVYSVLGATTRLAY